MQIKPPPARCPYRHRDVKEDAFSDRRHPTWRMQLQGAADQCVLYTYNAREHVQTHAHTTTHGAQTSVHAASLADEPHAGIGRPRCRGDRAWCSCYTPSRVVVGGLEGERERESTMAGSVWFCMFEPGFYDYAAVHRKRHDCAMWKIVPSPLSRRVSMQPRRWPEAAEKGESRPLVLFLFFCPFFFLFSCQRPFCVMLASSPIR